MPFVKDNLTVGMRHKGFDLPLQFYDPTSQRLRFGSKEGTGHHFHSFYFDRLFYFGVLGIAFFIVVMILPLYIAFARDEKLDTNSITLISFVSGGLVYGFAYNLPLFYWMFLGLTLAFIERNRYRLDTALSR